MSLPLPTKCEFHLSFFVCILPWTANAGSSVDGREQSVKKEGENF